jgi:hypothetical protein
MLPALAGIYLLTAAGCSSMNLGQIDETEDPRDDMPGPGIFSDEEGNTTLQWSNDKNQPSVEAAEVSSTTTDEKAEFEQFKLWNKLRIEDRESAEYQEFLQWLNYQDFKGKQ